MAAESEASPFARAAVIAAAVLVLYVLSIGPANRCSFVWHSTPTWVHTFYFPLVWTAEHCKPLDEALMWYNDLWTRDLPP